MVADYFTEDDFREVVHDSTSPYRYETADIDRAQEEVIDRLERYARTSWTARARTQTERSTAPLLLFDRVPVLAVTSVTLDGTAFTLSDLEMHFAIGRIRWGDWSIPGSPRLSTPGLVSIIYTYGFDYAAGAVPWSIRRPCIQASRTLLDGEEERGKIPRNTLRYSSERTDLTLGRRGAGKPWPWDSGASDDIRTYWDSSRPRQFISTVG